MNSMRSESQPTQLVIHNDDDTPNQFVMDLLRQVFGKTEREATALITQIEQKEKAICGPYPQSVAEALFKSAQQSIGLAGHQLQVTLEAIKTLCELCGKPEGKTDVRIGNRAVWLCGECMRAADGPSNEQEENFDFACDVLDWHFTATARSKLVTTIRQFPGHMRVDVQAAVDRLFGKATRLFGLNEEQRYETLSNSRLLKNGRYAVAIAPLQYSDVDVGEKSPVKCLDNGLWLCEQDHLRYAVLLCAHREYSREPGIRIEILVPSGSAGAALVQQCFSELEEAVQAARTYRGKILSLDADYRGRSRGITVHRLPQVARNDVILPEQTLRLLDRNVLTFVGTREQLRRLGQSTRKGILLYGPPGTGKTHTIRCLATHLPGHTTLIITAEQIGLLGAYMSLARLLQPSMVVIEDVDLIARGRDDMGPCEESMLNKLLNEMDGGGCRHPVRPDHKPDRGPRRRPRRSPGAHRSGDRSAAPRRDRPRQAGPALRQGTAARRRGYRRSRPPQRRHELCVHQGIDATAGAGEPGARWRQLGDVSRYRRGARRHAVLGRPAQCAIARRRTGYAGGVTPATRAVGSGRLTARK